MIRFAIIFLLVISPGALASDDWADDLTALDPVPPQYPMRALYLGVTAICRSTFDVDEAGSSTNLCVTCSLANKHDHPDHLMSELNQQFVEATSVAVAQWRYAEEHWNYRGSKSQFEFIMSGNTSSDLPPPPPERTCFGPRIS